MNPYKKTEAETMAWSEGVKATDDKDLGVFISSINNGDYIKVRDVDFGKGTKNFFARVVSSSTSRIEIKLDGIDGALIGTCNVNNTGGLDKWSTIHCKVKKASLNTLPHGRCL